MLDAALKRRSTTTATGYNNFGTTLKPNFAGTANGTAGEVAEKVGKTDSPRAEAREE